MVTKLNWRNVFNGVFEYTVVWTLAPDGGLVIGKRSRQFLCHGKNQRMEEAAKAKEGLTLEAVFSIFNDVVVRFDSLF